MKYVFLIAALWMLDFADAAFAVDVEHKKPEIVSPNKDMERAKRLIENNRRMDAILYGKKGRFESPNIDAARKGYKKRVWDY